MRRLLVYLAPYKRTVAVSIVLLLGNSIAQTLGPLLTKTAIDRYLVPVKGASAGPLEGWLSSDAFTGLLQISCIYLLAIVAGLLFEFFQTYLMTWTGQRAMLDLRRDLYAHMQKLDISFYDQSPVGRLVTRITTDVDQLNEMFSSGLVTILGDLLILSFIVAAMFQLSAGMTLLLLAVLPLVVLTTAIFRRSVSQSYRRTRVAIARINAYLQERVSGIAVLQLFNREKRSIDEFEKINRDHMDAFKEAIFAYGWFYPVVEFLSMLALALLLSYGGYRAGRGEMTLGVVVAFFQYGLRFFRPIQDLSEKYNILQSAMAAAERVLHLLDTKPQVVAPAQPVTVPADRAAIEFDHVWFSYKSGGENPDWVLRDVSFRIEPGETVAVVGHTGAGKTTLMSLLMRFYDVQQGSIRIGGRDIRSFDPADLRTHFGVVLQDAYLFTGTLAENIRLGTTSITDEDLVHAATRVNLMDFVQSLPDGFQHQIRERGAGLSTGQKQLVSFARALAHDPRFLILDEATSSVDTETEMRIRDALDRLVTGRTSFVIAHRLSTIQRADRILVMHKGQLRESGTHQELLAQKALYYRLYQLQYKDQESAPANIAPQEPLSEPATGFRD